MALIGALLSGAKDSREIFTMLSPHSFSDQRYAKLFSLMKDKFENNLPIDIITISEAAEFQTEFADQSNVLELLANISDACPSLLNAVSYAKEVEQSSFRRQISSVANKIQRLSSEDKTKSILDLKNDALKMLNDLKISDEKGIGNAYSDVLKQCIEEIKKKRLMTEEEAHRKYTGWRDFDYITDGLHNEELTIVAARPGIGKTQFALAMAKNIAKNRNNVLLFSREMGDTVLGNRFLSNLTGIEGHRIRTARNLTDREIEKLEEEVRKINEIKNTSNIILNTTAATIQEIRSIVRELTYQEKIDLVIVDYIGLVTVMNEKSERKSELEYISRQFKLMSIEYNIPILVLSQLNRNSERENREPILSDLRDCGAIEQDADNVFFLHIPVFADINGEEDFPIKLIIAKQRNGPLADIWLKNSRKNMTFSDPTKEEIQEYKMKDSSSGSRGRKTDDTGTFNI